MTPLTTHERMQRMLEHREADRVPITDYAWPATVARWRREGLPENVSWEEYFGLDRFVQIQADNSPRYPTTIIEETPEYVISTNVWGATLKNWKDHGGVPEFLDFKIRDRPTWQDAKNRMTPSGERVDWEHLRRNYPVWRQQGAWIEAGFWFGFDVTHSWAVGTERVLEAMMDDPEWLVDIFNTYLDLDLAMFEKVWAAGYRFDGIRWPDDMGFKGHQFFSLPTYREILKPVHRRAADWAHAKGIKVALHSCGDIHLMIPDLLEMGIDILNPIEVKAGMDPKALKSQYGDRLTLHGGLNAALFWEPEKMWAHMREVVPVLKEKGGYILSSDHSIPDSVSFGDFRQFVDLALDLGRY